MSELDFYDSEIFGKDKIGNCFYIRGSDAQLPYDEYFIIDFVLVEEGKIKEHCRFKGDHRTEGEFLDAWNDYVKIVGDVDYEIKVIEKYKIGKLK